MGLDGCCGCCVLPCGGFGAWRRVGLGCGRCGILEGTSPPTPSPAANAAARFKRGGPRRDLHPGGCRLPRSPLALPFALGRGGFLVEHLFVLTGASVPCYSLGIPFTNDKEPTMYDLPRNDAIAADHQGRAGVSACPYCGIVTDGSWCYCHEDGEEDGTEQPPTAESTAVASLHQCLDCGAEYLTGTHAPDCLSVVALFASRFTAGDEMGQDPEELSGAYIVNALRDPDAEPLDPVDGSSILAFVLTAQVGDVVRLGGGAAPVCILERVV